jgi:hypothetical protein
MSKESRKYYSVADKIYLETDNSNKAISIHDENDILENFDNYKHLKKDIFTNEDFIKKIGFKLSYTDFSTSGELVNVSVGNEIYYNTPEISTRKRIYEKENLDWSIIDYRREEFKKDENNVFGYQIDNTGFRIGNKDSISKLVKNDKYFELQSQTNISFINDLFKELDNIGVQLTEEQEKSILLN